MQYGVNTCGNFITEGYIHYIYIFACFMVVVDIQREMIPVPFPHIIHIFIYLRYIFINLRYINIYYDVAEYTNISVFGITLYRKMHSTVMDK